MSARKDRVAPATDTKQLASWNALCIEGFARAGLAQQREDWINTAHQALTFVREHLWTEEGLQAVHADGQTQYCAYLDDHAFLVRAILSLLKARWDGPACQFARELADAMIERYEDPDKGGFFFSAADQPAPVSRLRPMQDDATPGGNGMAILALEELGNLVAEPAYLESASRALMGAYPEMERHPLAHASLVMALSRHMAVPIQIIITGRDDTEINEWKKLANAHDRVNCYVFGPEEERSTEGLPGPPGLYAFDEQTTAYVSEGLHCLPPVKSVQALKQRLESMN